MSIATRTGDQGETALMYGRRVPKDHPRVKAYGAVDELNAALGLCRAHCRGANTRDFILETQKELIQVMAELATDQSDHGRLRNSAGNIMNGEPLQRLDAMIAELESSVGGLNDWILPGDNPSQAFFDLARTVCRRAEREVISLRHSGSQVRSNIIQYLNRLADILWLLGKETLS
ncbi:MAG: cob(I)yrinic acid a,c-diamide adenosyltransferase [Verrucomicrobiota bacterium]